MSRVAAAAAITIQCKTRMLLAKEKLRSLSEAEAKRKVTAAITIGSTFRALLAKRAMQARCSNVELHTPKSLESRKVVSVDVWLQRLLILVAFIALATGVLTRPESRVNLPLSIRSTVSNVTFVAMELRVSPSVAVPKVRPTKIGSLFRDQFKPEHIKSAIEFM